MRVRKLQSLVIHFTRPFLATPDFNPGYAYEGPVPRIQSTLVSGAEAKAPTRSSGSCRHHRLWRLGTELISDVLRNVQIKVNTRRRVRFVFTRTFTSYDVLAVSAIMHDINRRFTYLLTTGLSIEGAIRKVWRKICLRCDQPSYRGWLRSGQDRCNDCTSAMEVMFSWTLVS